MIQGQKLTDLLGNEICLFPMKTLNGSQFMNDKFTHKGAESLDNAGEDSGIDNVYAPCTVKCSSKDVVTIDGVNGVNFQTVKPVVCADGKLRHLTFRFIHDNDTSDIVLNHVYAQGERIANEGTKGFTTGNHSHMGVGIGHIEGAAITMNIYRVYEMINEISPVDVFFMNGTIIRNGGSYNWKTWSEPQTTYQTHIQNIGDSPVAKDWQISGTVGESKRLEAIIIHGHCTYRTHCQNIGWSPFVRDSWSGSKGRGLRLEAIEILADEGYTVEAQAHIANISWQPIQTGKDVTIGTTGKSLAIEAVAIKVSRVG